MKYVLVGLVIIFNLFILAGCGKNEDTITSEELATSFGILYKRFERIQEKNEQISFIVKDSQGKQYPEINLAPLSDSNGKKVEYLVCMRIGHDNEKLFLSIQKKSNHNKTSTRTIIQNPFKEMGYGVAYYQRDDFWSIFSGSLISRDDKKIEREAHIGYIINKK